MGRAEASRAEDDTGALDELRFHWGSAYDIGADGGLYTARRRDGKGAPLTDHLPEGLRLRIQADYEAMPVPRDPAVNGAGRQRGMPDADEDQALDALALAWGDAYDIYVVDGQWRAWREGAGDEDVLTGSTPDELNAAIQADNAREGTP
ncbi:MAG: hypothetical protein ACLP8X_38020 [Streptosporangiaceae bacterium]